MNDKITKKYSLQTRKSMLIMNDLNTAKDILKAAGVVDVVLLPLFEKAVQGDHAALIDVCEYFTYGKNKVTPNFDIALHFWTKIHQLHQTINDPVLHSESLNSYAFIHLEFDRLEEATIAFLKAFQYMVSSLTPNNWDKDVLQMVIDNIAIYKERSTTD